jgi:hypothetical protein
MPSLPPPKTTMRSLMATARCPCRGLGCGPVGFVIRFHFNTGAAMMIADHIIFQGIHINATVVQARCPCPDALGSRGFPPPRISTRGFFSNSPQSQWSRLTARYPSLSSRPMSRASRGRGRPPAPVDYRKKSRDVGPMARRGRGNG